MMLGRSRTCQMLLVIRELRHVFSHIMRFGFLAALPVGACTVGHADYVLDKTAVTLPTPLAVPSPATSDPRTAAPPAELTIQYVQRLPAIDFVPGSSNPRVEGWPSVGQSVTWQAHVKNWFPTTQDVAYSWRLDGAEVGGGSLTIAPDAVGIAEYSSPWAFERHELAFVVDPANLIAEEEEHNNQVTVITDAISIGFYVEQSMYDHFRAHQHDLPGVHSTSFEDWAQRQVTLYNELFRRAVYPETPQGVTERVRLDKITIVADLALPLDQGGNPGGGETDAASARPNGADRTVDLQWGFPSSVIANYQDFTDFDIFNQFYYYSGSVQHELGHARTMVDVYGETVYDGLPGHEVDIEENGEKLGIPFMPREKINFNGHDGFKMCAQENGLMADTWTYLDRLSAIVWNKMAGERARLGNFNAPADIGWFMNELLPAQNRIRVVDRSGSPVAGASLSIYQGTDPSIPVQVPYGRIFDDEPDLSADTDGDGVALLPRNPFAPAGQPVVHTEPFSNATAIVRAEKDGVAYFCLFASDLIEAGAR